MKQPETTKELNDFYIHIEYERGNIDYASLMEMVDITDLKSVGDNAVPVRVRQEAPITPTKLSRDFYA